MTTTCTWCGRQIDDGGHDACVASILAGEERPRQVNPAEVLLADEHAPLKMFPWFAFPGEDARSSVEEALTEYVIAHVESADVPEGVRVPMEIERCRPATSVQIAMWLAGKIGSWVPDWLHDSDFLSEDHAELLDIPDSAYPDIARALLPYIDTYVRPDQVMAFGPTIKLEPDDWRGYAGVYVDEDGTVVRYYDPGGE